MSYLDKIVEANERLLKGELAMQVRIPYSLAAELAKKADQAVDLSQFQQAVDLLRGDAGNWAFPAQRHDLVNHLQLLIDGQSDE